MPNPEIDALYITFSTFYEITYDFPYSNKAADFIQLHKLLKLDRERTKERWEQACENYFASELGFHTLADFSVRFATFQRSPLDRYGKPIIIQAKESVNEQRLGEMARRWNNAPSNEDRATGGQSQNGLRIVGSRR